MLWLRGHKSFRPHNFYAKCIYSIFVYITRSIPYALGSNWLHCQMVPLPNTLSYLTCLLTTTTEPTEQNWRTCPAECMPVTDPSCPWGRDEIFPWDDHVSVGSSCVCGARGIGGVASSASSRLHCYCKEAVNCICACLLLCWKRKKMHVRTGDLTSDLHKLLRASQSQQTHSAWSVKNQHCCLLLREIQNTVTAHQGKYRNLYSFRSFRTRLKRNRMFSTCYRFS